MCLLKQLVCVSNETFLIPFMKRNATLYNRKFRTISSLQSLLKPSILKTSTKERKPVLMIRPYNVITFHHNHLYTSQLRWSNEKLVPNEMTETQYDAIAEETLNSLYDFFDALPELVSCTEEYDSEFGGGVLNVHFSKTDGTYVINKQAPNKQIWLSSPKTGPKRYDFCGDQWIYRHDGVGLHHLLEKEVSEILGEKLSLKDCKHYSS